MRSPLAQLSFTLFAVWITGALFVFDLPELEPPPPIPEAKASPSTPSTPAASAPGPAPSSSPPREIDDSPQRILMFGDSMIDELMLRLADYAAHNGHDLRPAIWYGASTVHWSQSSRLRQLVAQHDPTFVIAVIGSAELTTRRLGPRRAAIARILREVGNRKLVWIGPPSWTEDTGIDDLLAELVGRGRYFRSSRWVRDNEVARKRDGIHPTREASAAWLDAVARWITTESTVPIRLDLPVEEAPRPVAQVFPPPGG
jgi:hypothetical protein